MTRISVLVDTNILFSGIIYSGPEALLLDLARENVITLLVPHYVVEELRAVVSRKMPGASRLLEDFLNQDYIKCLPSPPEHLVLKAQEIIRDQKDSIVLASALSTKPDYMVSGDKDFHTPEVKAVARVISARELLRQLHREG